MKKNFFVLVIFFGIVSGLSAHYSCFQPEPGRIDASIGWVLVEGIAKTIWWEVDPQDQLTEYGYHAVSARVDPGTGGFSLLVEFGIIPGISAGGVTNLAQYLIYAGRGDQEQNLDLTLFSKINAFSFGMYQLQLQGAIELAPLIKTGQQLGSTHGYFNCFLTLNSNLKLWESTDSEIRFFMDAKAMTTLFNPWLRRPEDQFAVTMGIDPESIRHVASVTGPVYKLTLEPGFDGKWGSFIIYTGFNIPIYSFTSHYPLKSIIDNYSPTLLDFDLGWKYQF